jgi:predicted amidophosphoribosyltransferase
MTTKRKIDSSGNALVPDVYCPKCGAQVVYNGNYFCQRFEYPLTKEGCNWALSHNNRNGDPISKVDKRIWEEIQASWVKWID